MEAASRTAPELTLCLAQQAAGNDYCMSGTTNRFGVLLVLSLAAGSCSKPPATTASLPATTELVESESPVAGSSGLAVVVGKVPVPSAIVTLTPDAGEALPPSAPPVLDQSGRRFFPDLLLARTGYPVTFGNSDTELHNINVKELTSKDQAFNVALPIGGTYSYTFKQDGLYNVRCDLHPEMASEIMVSSSPYVAIADEGGAFSVENVPTGSYTMRMYGGNDTVEKTVTVTSPRTEVNLAASAGG
jgi:plastocyanin